MTKGWISRGATGAPNYDEFAADSEVTAAIEHRPDCVLAVEMPHRTPESVSAGRDFFESLVAARQHLNRLRDSGALQEVTDVVVPYRIQTSEGPALGVFCMVDTGQISSSADEPGQIIRNEDVFIEKVRQRVALTDAICTLASAVLLLHTDATVGLHAYLAGLVDSLGAPDAADVDTHGNLHEMWLLEAGDDRDRLLELAGSGELIVADGNHRSLAAQIGGLPRFLGALTTPESVKIRSYHRLVRDLGIIAFDDVVTSLARGGIAVAELDADAELSPSEPGTVVLYTSSRAVELNLPVPVLGSPEPGSPDFVESMDHAVIERELFNRVLGMEAGDKRITYVGGDYPASWLVNEVDSGREALAVLLAPVGVSDFISVNSARKQLPRKSTWFTPKVRAGLVLSAVDNSVR
ncbi:MAG: DUF1015 family protein [Mycobacteriales bacterium]